MFGMSAFYFISAELSLTPTLYPNGHTSLKGRGRKGEKMNTQTEAKMTVKIAEVPAETENPMQERHIGEVAESVEVTAEEVLTARRLEAKEGTGFVFVP
jgi:hypothetical protein